MEDGADGADGRLVKGRATRNALVLAARAQFGHDGYERTSIEAILEEAGVARGALYHHFANKAELFDAVLDLEMATMATTIAEAARPASTPLESLRNGCAAFFRLILDPAVRRITLLDAQTVVGWARWREIDRKYTLGGLQVAIGRLAADGRAEPDQVDILAHMVLAAVGEAAMVVATADDPEAALPLAYATVDSFLTRLFAKPRP